MSRGMQLSLKQKIGSINSTMHVTKAMQMIATARLQQLKKNFKNFYEYEKEFSLIFERITAGVNDPMDVGDLLWKEPPSKILIVVITGDMGLCGTYNDDIILLSYKRADELGEHFYGFYTIGSKAKTKMKFDGKTMVRSVTEMYSKPSYDEAQSLSNEFIKFYNENEIDGVEIIHGYSKNSLIHSVKSDQFLPVKINEGTKNVLYDYEPESAELLKTILPQYFGAKMYRILLESRISEQNARQNAMKNATDNAKKLIDGLNLKYNKARQFYITQEVIEVLNGAEALRGEK